MPGVSDIFAFWPSDADLARDIGVPYPTVSAWKQRGSIPTGYWRTVIGVARKRGYRGVTADFLVDAHARAADETVTGFQDSESTPFASDGEGASEDNEARRSGDGQFSRHKDARRSRFRTGEEIEDHIRALRDEWSER